MTRHDLKALRALYELPFFDLISRAREVYRQSWPEHEVQLCTLMSIKTGGCSEDCAYCAQSSHYDTGLERESLAPLEQIVETAERARANGSTRFCMGAAWKGVTEHDAKFAQVIATVREVAKLGMEVCVTLGQLTPEAARQLRAAGVTAYNHNLDTSPEFYPNIVTTHTFEDRLNTIRAVQASGMSVCCGGIIGMGETELDRLKLLEVLCGFDPAPESVPINCLMPMDGTPLAGQAPRGYFPARAADRDDADGAAEGAGALVGGSHAADARGPGTLLLRRRELDLLRRQAADRGESGRGCGPLAAG